MIVDRPVISQFNGDFKFLSNFYEPEQGIAFRYLKWPTSEHAYQAYKSTDPEDREWIREASSPSEAKARGRKISLRDGWKVMRRQIMYCVLRAKFSNDDLAQKLLDTRPALLVESNGWGDDYWGVCEGSGENHLGRLLMRVRSEIARGYDANT